MPLVAYSPRESAVIRADLVKIHLFSIISLVGIGQNQVKSRECTSGFLKRLKYLITAMAPLFICPSSSVIIKHLKYKCCQAELEPSKS